MAIRPRFDLYVYSEPDGSKWFRIFHHNNPNAGVFTTHTDAEWTAGVFESADKWFDLAVFNNYTTSWEMMVKQAATSGGTVQKWRWVQTANPLTTTTWDPVKPGTVTFNDSSEYSTSSFGGLYTKGGNARICIANATSSNWFGAIGCWTAYNNGIPGYPNTTVTTGYLDLYVRADTLLEIFKTGTGLEVWFPFNKDKNNYGLNLDVTKNYTTGVLSTADNGKFNQCHYGYGIYHLENEFLSNTWTLATWYKASAFGQYNNIIFCKNIKESTDCHIYWSIISNTTFNVGINGPSGTTTYAYTFNTNQWYHLATSYDGATIKMYINGELVRSVAYVSSSPPAGRLNLGIGERASNEGGTSGTGMTSSYFNDFRIYNRVISPKEVKELSKGLALHYKLNDAYIEGTSNGIPFQSDFASWSSYGFGSTGTKTILTGPTPNGTNVYCRVGSTRTTAGTTEMARWTTAIGALSPNGKATFSAYVRGIGDMIGKNGFLHVYNTINGKTQSNNVKNFTFTAEWQRVDGQFTWVQDEASATSYSVYVCGTNMVAENEFEFCEAQFELKDHVTAWVNGTRDNSTTIYDTSGFGNDGTASTNLTVLNSSPRYSNATYLTSAAIIAHSRCLSNTNQEWTCTAWIKPDTAGGHQSLNNFNRNNKLYHGTYPLLYLNDGTNDYYNYGNLALPAGQWSHIAFVFNNTTGTKLIYINGVEHTNKSGPNKTSTPAGIPDTVAIGSQYAGYISDYREYATALSAEDVLELYQTSGSIDNQGNAYAREVIE